MQATWVVVADSDCATIYSVPRGMARLRPIHELRRVRNAINGDTGGSPGGDGWRPDQAPAEVDQQARRFAAQVARLVEDAGREPRFDELILVAPATFLAYLRENLSYGVRQAVVAEVAKNLVGAQPEKLQEQVLRVL